MGKDVLIRAVPAVATAGPAKPKPKGKEEK